MTQNQISKNTNLFYQLYSHPQKVAQSGYMCSSAIDESDTSFDISDGEAQITDSNGDVIESIDLSDIHADELTEYYTETKILGGQSAFLLQGNCTGETYAAQYFKVRDEIQTIEDYEPFVNIKFDIHWTACGDMNAATIDTTIIRTEAGSVTELIQSELDKNCIPVSVSIQNLEMCANCKLKSCSSCSKTTDYLVFQSQEEGFAFFVHNVYIGAVDTEYENYDGSWGDYTDSPFVNGNITFDYIIDLIRKNAPSYACSSCNCKKPDYSDIPCDLYKFMVSIAPLALNDKEAFRYNFLGLREFSKYMNKFGEVENERGFMTTAERFPDLYSFYFEDNLGILNKYNIHDIIAMLNDVSVYIHSSNITGPYKMEEEYYRRLNPQKYPNGALRGIVIIPQWPDGEGDYSALKIAHVSDNVMIDEKVELPKDFKLIGISKNDSAQLYRKIQATVKINTLLQSEYEIYNQTMCNMPLKKVVSNNSLKQNTDSMWTSDLHGLISNQSKWCTDMDWHDVTNAKWCQSADFHDVYKLDKKYTEFEYPAGIKGHVHFLIREDYVNEYTVPDKYNYLSRIPGRTVKDTEYNSENVIGLYRYMQYLNENNLWIKVGEAYIVIGKKDDYQSLEKNLLNSVLIYNPNNVPIRIKTLVFS